MSNLWFKNLADVPTNHCDLEILQMFKWIVNQASYEIVGCIWNTWSCWLWPCCSLLRSSSATDSYEDGFDWFRRWSNWCWSLEFTCCFTRRFQSMFCSSYFIKYFLTIYLLVIVLTLSVQMHNWSLTQLVVIHKMINLNSFSPYIQLINIVFWSFIRLRYDGNHHRLCALHKCFSIPHHIQLHVPWWCYCVSCRTIQFVIYFLSGFCSSSHCKVHCKDDMTNNVIYRCKYWSPLTYSQ